MDYNILINEIDKYIAKANSKLIDRLGKEGFLKVKETVAAIDALEEELEAEFSEEAEALSGLMADSSRSAAGFYDKEFQDFKEENEKGSAFKTILFLSAAALIPLLLNAYAKSAEPDLPETKASNKLNDEVARWCEQFGVIMGGNAMAAFDRIIAQGIADGKTAAQVALDIANTDLYANARNAAITEVLRAHAMSQQEAYMQCPSVTKKKWLHCDSEHPRENHIDMHGQTVDVDKPFTLAGKDGTTYYPMYPLDVTLPPGESINCHCIMQYVKDESIAALPAEERMKMREAYCTGELREDERSAIDQYVHSQSYIINEKLRQNLPLTSEEKSLIISLDRALDKMPKYAGSLSRSLYFAHEDDLQKFLKSYKVGGAVEYKEYISTTCSPTSYNPEGQIQIYITNSINGRNIMQYNPDEAEVLYQRGSKFKVTDIQNKNGVVDIYMKEG